MGWGGLAGAGPGPSGGFRFDDEDDLADSAEDTATAEDQARPTRAYAVASWRRQQ